MPPSRERDAMLRQKCIVASASPGCAVPGAPLRKVVNLVDEFYVNVRPPYGSAPGLEPAECQ